MSSNINPTSINEAFPVSGINQSSQGFRSNFSSIKNNFVTAKSEISSIQSTQITVTGDVINNGTPPILGQPTTLSIPLSLSLSNIITGETLNTYSTDYQIVVDDKGRISGITSTEKQEYVGDSNPQIKITTNTEDVNYPNDTGIKTLSIPTYTINEYGNISKTTYQDISGFGLLGYDMPSNSILVGNSLSESTYLKSPDSITAQYVLTYTNGVLVWDKFSLPSNGMVTSIIPGNYISTSGSEDVTVNFDTTKISEITNLPNTSLFLIKNNDSTLGAMSTDNIQNTFVGFGFLKNVNQDKNPKLGGNLDLNGYNITSSGNLDITISGTTSINGIIYPKSAPSNDSSYLVYNKDGTTSFTNTSSDLVLSGTNGVSVTTSTTGKTISLDYTNMIENSSNLNNSDIVVLDKSNNTTKLVKLSTFFGDYDNIVFVSPDNGIDTNDGSFNSPYKTISTAMQNNQNIILMPGTYTESLSINTSELKIIGMNEEITNFSGSINLSSQTTDLYFYGIKFSIGAESSYLLSTYTTNGNITFEKCSFNDNSESVTSIFNLEGTIENLILKNCYIDAFIQNNFTSGNIIIDGDYISDKKLRYDNNSTGTSYIRNISKLLSIKHTSGTIILDNIDLIFDDITNNLNSITGSSSITTDKFVIKNSSLYDTISNTCGYVDLSGTALCYFENLISDKTKDVITYSLLSYDPLNVDFYPIKELSITSTSYNLDSYDKFLKISNTVQTMITLSPPSTKYYGTNVGIKISLKLVGSGNGAINFSNLISTSGYEVNFDGTNNTSVILDLFWDNDLNSWNCINRYISSSGASTPTLTSVTENIIATGSSISNATKLLSKYNIVTSTQSGNGVILPSISIGDSLTVINRSGLNISVYPDTGSSKVETLSYGAPQNMISGGSATFIKTTSILWRVI